MKTKKLRFGRFVNFLVVYCGQRFRYAPIFPYFQRSSIGCEVLFRTEAINWKSALGILAYINGTCGFGITYHRGTTVGISLEVFPDACYASKATDRRSVSGGAIMRAVACVCWLSQTQKYVTLCTSEAEYVALGDAMK